MKVIFLDIDGVLNNVSSAREGKWVQSLDYTNWVWVSLVMLDLMCLATESKVVISSTWRKLEPSVSWWNAQFAAAKMDRVEVIGITPISRNGFRGREINEWLACHPEVDRYLIVDDDSDFYPDQPFLWIDGEYGLKSAAQLIAAINWLNNGILPPPHKRIEERNPPSDA